MKAKRLIAFMLTLCMVVTAIMTVTVPVVQAEEAVATEFSDVSEDASYFEAVRVLNSLGIILGYPDGTFLPNKAVTRAEFTTLLIRAMDMEELAKQSYVASQMPFTDCVNEGISYAFPNILFAYNKGIIKGMDATTFAPENEVTYEQAVKMVVCAAGYGYVVDTEEGGYPNGYIARAGQMELLDGVKGSMGVAATRWQIAQLLYNAFDCNLMEKISQDSNMYMVNENKTWLKEFLGMYSDSGMVTADNVTSISSSAVSPGVGQCLIRLDKAGEERAFNLGSYTVSHLIGKNVSILYSYDEGSREYNIEYLGDLSNLTTSVVLDVEDIIDFDDIDIYNGDVVEYWKDADSDRARKDDFKIAPNVTLVLNGKSYNPTPSQFKSEMQSLVEGQVEFVTDKNSDQVTKMFITKVDTYVANTVTTDSRSGVVTVIDLYRNTSKDQKNSLAIDVEDTAKTINIYDKSGKPIEQSTISKYSTLSIVQSKNTAGRDLMNIYVSNASVTGTVSEITTDGEVTINGTVYKVSPYYETYAVGNDPSNKITLNTTATFYLDRNDKITAMKKDSESYSYAYVYALGSTTNSSLEDDSFVLKYVDQSGKKEKIIIDYKVEYDGTRLDPIDGMAHLQNSARATNFDKTSDDRRSVYSQVIKYSKNSSGKIATIATVSDLADEYVTDRLSGTALTYSQKDDGSYEPLTYKYSNSSSGSFGNATKVLVNSSTIVFVVGNDRDEDNVKKSSVANELDGATDYVVELYDEKSTIAKVCVVYKDKTTETVTVATPITIIDDIVSISTRNNEGEAGEKAEVFVGKTTFSKDTILSASEGTFSNWGEGSVVKVLKNSYGDVKSDAEGSVVVWDVTSSRMPSANEWVNKSAKSHNGTAYRILVGVVESFDPETGILVFIPSTDFDSIDADVDEEGNVVKTERETFTINHTSESSCGFVVYDSSYDDADPVYGITYEELAGSLVTYEDDPDNAKEVLIYLTGSQSSLTPKLIYVINR